MRVTVGCEVPRIRASSLSLLRLFLMSSEISFIPMFLGIFSFQYMHITCTGSLNLRVLPSSNGYTLLSFHPLTLARVNSLAEFRGLCRHDLHFDLWLMGRAHEKRSESHLDFGERVGRRLGKPQWWRYVWEK